MYTADLNTYSSLRKQATTDTGLAWTVGDS